VFVERGDNFFPCPSERFVQTVAVQTAPTQRSLARYAARLKPRIKRHGVTDGKLVALLRAYVGNYVKRVDVSLANMTTFTVKERAAYLFRELESFQTGLYIVWALPATEAAALVTAGPVAACAAADAIQCVLRNDLAWTYRSQAPEHAAFFEEVKRAVLANTALQRVAATRTPLALPCHAALDEFTKAEHEHHLASLKGREAQCVERRVYE
jgi:hypothetical protein